MKVLDAGCGTGSVTRVMHQVAEQRGCTQITYHAFDLTPAMLDLFREWVQAEGLQNISMQPADVLDLENQLPADWTGYDWIVSSAMLEYIPKEKRLQALIALKQLLHPDGRLLLFLTRRTWITQWVGGLWWRTNLFSREQIAADLQQVGFSKLQFKKLAYRWNKFMLVVEASGSS